MITGLTPIGKLVFGGTALILIIAGAFLLFPSIHFSLPTMPKIQIPSFDGGGTPLVKVFVSSSGKDSNYALSMLREISRSPEFKGKFEYQILQFETSSAQAAAFKITKVPSFIIGSRLYEGIQAREFIEGRLREIIKK